MQLSKAIAVALAVATISLIVHLSNAPLSLNIRSLSELSSNASELPVLSRDREPFEGVINVESLALSSETVPTEAIDYVEHKPFADTVFAVLTDGIMESRLNAALSTWLRDSFHTFLFFTNVSLSRQLAAKYQGVINITVVLLTPPTADVRTANWKNLPIVQYLGRQETWSFLRELSSTKSRQERPLWFSIVDDDTYLLGPALSFLLRNFTVLLKKEDESSLMPLEQRSRLYIGHRVVHCQRCRTVTKRFPFAFGGNGIFLSVAVVFSLARVVDKCGHLSSLPGDEQVGGCIHKYKLASLTHIAVGTETISMAFGDKAAEVLHEPFPFSFHRIKYRQWATDLHALEMRHAGKILLWPHIAQYFLVDKAAVYNTARLVFQETLNSSEVQSFLATRRSSPLFKGQ